MNIPKKVFVSYKYNDVVEGREDKFNYRDELVNLLGDNGLMHKGEDDKSFDMSDFTDGEVYQKISPYVKNSSITVVLITPRAKESKWIPWEISLSLKERTYKEESKMTRNGLIGVYLPLDRYNMPVEKGGSYSFYMKRNSCGTISHFTSKLPQMIRDNSFNLRNGSHICDDGCCNDVYDSSTGSYIQLIQWDDFISDIETYLDKAWKRRNSFDEYEVRINLKNGK